MFPRSRVLILIAEEISGQSLARELADRGEGPAATSVVVVAEAQRKVDASVALLRNQGYTVVGKVGDSNPIRAIEDALAEFPSKGVIVATHSAGGMKLERYLIELLTREGTGVTRVATAPLGDHPLARPAADYPPRCTPKSPLQADDRHVASTEHR